MIECHKIINLQIIKRDYDEFILLFTITFFLIWYLQKSFGRALFKSAIVTLLFLIIYTSCYNINYIQALGICLGVGMYLEQAYELVQSFIMEWLYSKRKDMLDIIKNYKRCNNDKK